MSNLLLDSNIIIGVVKNRFPVSKLEKFSLIVSEITRLEIFGYHKLGKQEEELLTRFFTNVECLSVTKTIIDQAIQLRKQKSKSVGDAIIAATAKKHDLPLMTANTKDFKHIDQLEVINPLEN